MTYLTDNRSLSELVGDLSREISTIVRKEFELARTELSGKTRRIGAHAGAIVAGGVLAWGGFMTLVASLVLVLVRVGMPAWGAALLVGITLLGVGALLAQRGLQRLRSIDITPHQTIRTMKENVAWAKARTT